MSNNLSRSLCTRVLLVSEGNPFLEWVLASFPQIEARVTDEPTELLGYDVVILDRLQPPVLSAANYFFIATLPAQLSLRAAGTVPFPQISGWQRDHPVLSSVDLSEG